MDALVSRLLGAVRLGEPSSMAGLTLVPVFAEIAAGPSYITLAEALSLGSLTIAEVDEHGSVPELCARNTGDVGVLMLDGEELRGAKQNRVLSTTVYLSPGREITIPVSCVEQGRWRFDSSGFRDSGYVANHRVRQAQKESVTASVREVGAYRSDQSRVWREVAGLAADFCAPSDTGAMRDVFEQKRAALDAFVGEFAPVQGQRGIMALIGGRVTGLDVVSRPKAYAELHARLVRSYAFDALREAVAPGKDDLRAAKEFLVDVASVKSTQHKSPGSGTSHRFTGASVVGDALTYRSAILHAAFFAGEPAPGAEDFQSRMRSARERRRYRDV